MVLMASGLKYSFLPFENQLCLKVLEVARASHMWYGDFDLVYQLTIDVDNRYLRCKYISIPQWFNKIQLNGLIF